MISRRNRRAEGFTLLEVLVALTILGLGIVTLLQVFSLGLRLGTSSAAATEAVTQGARVMDDLLARKRLSDGWESGEMVGGAGRWRAEIRPPRDAGATLSLSNLWELKEVVVELRVDEGGRERRVEFRTLRLSRKGDS